MCCNLLLPIYHQEPLLCHWIFLCTIDVQHHVKQSPNLPLDVLPIFYFVDLSLSLGCFCSNYHWCWGHMSLSQRQLPGSLLKQATHSL